MKVTYRLHYRSWIPDVDGGEGHAHECKPRDFDSLPELYAYRDRVHRLYDWRIHRIVDEPIEWGDPLEW